MIEPQEPQDRLLRVSEAAAILAIHPRSCRRLIDDGLLTRVQLRGAVRVRLSEVTKLVAGETDELGA